MILTEGISPADGNSRTNLSGTRIAVGRDSGKRSNAHRRGNSHRKKGRNSQVTNRAGSASFLLFLYEKMTIVTNNPDVKSKYEGDHTVIFVEGGYKDVLVKVRDLVHEGHQLLTHPLMGSLKPNETPYRSIAVSAKKGPVDTDSVILISESIETFDKFAKIVRPDRGTNTPERLLADFRLIDLTLISSAVDFH